MKFEFKTDNEINSSSLLNLLRILSNVALIIILSDVTLKLGLISRHYQINYFCNILSVEKSSSNFKKLSKLSNLKSKQRIWEFCRAIVK